LCDACLQLPLMLSMLRTGHDSLPFAALVPRCLKGGIITQMHARRAGTGTSDPSMNRSFLSSSRSSDRSYTHPPESNVRCLPGQARGIISGSTASAPARTHGLGQHNRTAAFSSAGRTAVSSQLNAELGRQQQGFAARGAAGAASALAPADSRPSAFADADARSVYIHLPFCKSKCFYCEELCCLPVQPTHCIAVCMAS